MSRCLTFVAALFATALLVTDPSPCIAADQDSCLQTRQHALQTLDSAFKSKTELWSTVRERLRKSDLAADVNQQEIEKILSDLSSQKTQLVEEVERAARECPKIANGPESIAIIVDRVEGDSLFFTENFLKALDNPEALWGGSNSIIQKLDWAVTPLSPASQTPSSNATSSPLDVALNKLVAGNIVFNNPERMTVGRSRIVEVKLSTRLSPDELKSKLTEAGKKESAELKVGDRMSATLNGGGAFDISPSVPQVQWIDQTQVTTWAWSVTPKLVGTQYLLLTFDAVISIDGKDGTRNVSTLTHQIDVEVGWPTSVSEWFDLLKNISWLWATILVPLTLFFVGLWRRIKRRRFKHDGASPAFNSDGTPPFIS